MAEKMLPAREDLMRELKEMEELLSSKQSYMRMVPERATKRFPRFTISTEMSIRSMFGEISENAEEEEMVGADSK